MIPFAWRSLELPSAIHLFNECARHNRYCELRENRMTGKVFHPRLALIASGCNNDLARSGRNAEVMFVLAHVSSRNTRRDVDRLRSPRLARRHGDRGHRGGLASRHTRLFGEVSGNARDNVCTLMSNPQPLTQFGTVASGCTRTNSSGRSQCASHFGSAACPARRGATSPLSRRRCLRHRIHDPLTRYFTAA